MDISDFKNLNVLIVGMGLMGGAFADAVKNLDAKGIYGIDKNITNLRNAEKKGLIQKGYTDASQIVPLCDFIIICIYLNDSIEFIKNNMPIFKTNCIITDIVGVKRKMIKELENIIRPDVDYIPGHPMAGKEKQGFGYADKSIFIDRNYILTPTEKNKPENILFLEQFIKAVGFKYIVTTDPKDHDKKIAFTSQLCHIIAAGMVDINDDEETIHYEGGSYKDMTRIAIINSEMWTELFIANKDMLINEIEKLQNSLGFFKELIMKEDESIIDKLDDIKNKREHFNNL